MDMVLVVIVVGSILAVAVLVYWEWQKRGRHEAFYIVYQVSDSKGRGMMFYEDEQDARDYAMTMWPTASSGSEIIEVQIVRRGTFLFTSKAVQNIREARQADAASE